MNIIIFGLDVNSYESAAEYLSSGFCDWVVDDEGDTIDVKLSDSTKMILEQNCVELVFKGRSVLLERTDYNYIKIE